MIYVHIIIGWLKYIVLMNTQVQAHQSKLRQNQTSDEGQSWHCQDTKLLQEVEGHFLVYVGSIWRWLIHSSIILRYCDTILLYQQNNMIFEVLETRLVELAECLYGRDQFPLSDRESQNLH